MRRLKALTRKSAAIISDGHGSEIYEAFEVLLGQRRQRHRIVKVSIRVKDDRVLVSTEAAITAGLSRSVADEKSHQSSKQHYCGPLHECSSSRSYFDCQFAFGPALFGFVTMRRRRPNCFALTDAAGLESRLRGGFSAATSIRFAPSLIYARGRCETRHPVHKVFWYKFS